MTMSDRRIPTIEELNSIGLDRLREALDKSRDLATIRAAARKWLEPPSEAAIEATALEIFKADEGDWPSEVDVWTEMLSEPERDGYRMVARAAIEAYRTTELEFG